MGGTSSKETKETINIINDNMQAQGRNTMDSSDHMKHIYYGETLSLVTKIFAIVGLIGTIIFIIRCCIAYHKLQRRSSRSNHSKKDINTNKQLNENIIRKIEETDYNVYRLSESLEEMKIKLDYLFEIQLSNKNIRKTHSKTLYHLSGTIPRLLMEASNEELKDMVHQMRERCFGVDGKDRIENMKLRKFLVDNTIKRKALELIQNEGKFCKFVADILIPNSQILKFYFPSQYTRRNKDQLFGQDTVKEFMITAKYLGAGIISEFKQSAKDTIYCRSAGDLKSAEHWVVRTILRAF
uniref:Uncharacterized protein n=1 Tax=Strongyloides papillosus TaxID=174720 RepID=A0A0N5CHJ5_STREA